MEEVDKKVMKNWYFEKRVILWARLVECLIANDANTLFKEFQNKLRLRI